MKYVKYLTIQSVLLIFISFKAVCQNHEIRLVVRADDIGFCHAANQAIIKTCKEGIASSAEIIAPGPWFLEAAKMLNENPKIDVGVHLTLNSEWENYKWRPLTYAPTLTDSNGYFFPFIWSNSKLYKQNAGNFLDENNPDIKEIENEFRAQIEMVKKHVKNVTHITTHMGCIDLNPEVTALVKRLTLEYNLDYADFGAYSFKSNLANNIDLVNEKTFIKTLKNMEPGKTYFLVSHPCLNTSESKQLFHATNYKMSEDRAEETKVLTSPAVMKLIKERNIKLLTVKQLFETK